MEKEAVVKESPLKSLESLRSVRRVPVLHLLLQKNQHQYLMLSLTPWKIHQLLKLTLGFKILKEK